MWDEQTVEEEEETLWTLFTLQFRDPSLEARYLDQANGIFARDDIVGHIMCIVGTILCLSDTVGYIPAYHIPIFMLFGGIMFPAFIYCWWSHHSVYRTNRLAALFVVRIIVPLHAGAVLVDLSKPLKPTMKEVAGRVFFQSPVSLLIALTAYFRLPFRQWIQHHTLSMVFCCPWVKGFCSTCSRVEGVAPVITLIGKRLNLLSLHAFTMGGLVVPDVEVSPMPCWKVTLLTHMLVGWIVPCFLIYVVEGFSRAKFLDSALGWRYAGMISDRLFLTVIVGVKVLLMGWGILGLTLMEM